jgi:hypothetical protein
MVFKRLAKENGVFSENLNLLYTETTNPQSKQTTMTYGNLPDIFLGLWLKAL